MKLVELTVTQYLEALASEAPAPGGGSAAALAGAQGAALAAMVANLTIGKKKYAEFESVNLAARDRAMELAQRLAEQIDADTEAFNLVSAAYKLPKETDGEKQTRIAAIAEATLRATQAPFHTMELALEALKAVQSLVGASNTNCASDLGVAALQLACCARGAWMNVLINLPGIALEADKQKFAGDGREILARCQALAGEIADAVEKGIS